MRWPYPNIGVLTTRAFRNLLNKIFGDIGSDLQEQKSRVDNLITSNPQPSEVQDIRTAQDGTVYPTARDRINADYTKTNQKVDENQAATAAQLAEEVQQRQNGDNVLQDYVQNLINSIQGGGPRDVFYTLTALQAAYPSGTDGTFLVLDTDPSYPHLYGWSSTDNAWKDLGAYNSTLQEVVDARTTQDGATFQTLKQHINGIESSEKIFKTNMFDKSSVETGVSVQTNTSHTIDHTVENPDFNSSPIIDVKPNTIYKLYVVGDDGNVFNQNRSAITFVEADSNQQITVATSIPADSDLTITTGSTTHYLRFHYKNITVTDGGYVHVQDVFMLIEGSFLPKKYYSYNELVSGISFDVNDLKDKTVSDESYFSRNCKLIEKTGSIYDMDNLSPVSNCSINDEYSKIKPFCKKSKRVYGTNNGDVYFKYVFDKEIKNWESVTFVFYQPYSTYDGSSSTSGYVNMFFSDTDALSTIGSHFNGYSKWGWNYVKITKSMINNVCKDLKAIYFKLTPRGTVAIGADFGQIVFNSIIVNQKIKPTILLNFDQIWQESIDNGGYQYAFDHNVPFTIFSNEWSALTSSQLALAHMLINKYNGEVGVYGCDGSNSYINSATDYITGKGYMETTKNGFINEFQQRPLSYASSQAVYTPLMECILKDLGFKMIRALNSNQIGYYDKDCDLIPMYDIQLNTLPDIETQINRAITDGSCLPLFTHGIANDEGSAIPSTSITLTNFKGLIDYIVSLRNAGEIQVLTFKDFYKNCIG